MHKIFQQLKVVALAIVFSFGLSYVYAWTAPNVAPPGGNVSAPINTGNTTQYKAGNLVLNDSATPFTNGLIVRYGNVGIGTPTPGTKLDVAGTIKATGLQFTAGAGAGKVLTSDASGNATWVTAAVGNQGATPGTYGGECRNRCTNANGICWSTGWVTDVISPAATCGVAGLPAGYSVCGVYNPSGEKAILSCVSGWRLSVGFPLSHSCGTDVNGQTIEKTSKCGIKE